METTNNSGMKTVYTIVTREGKSYWVRCGAGFPNKDGSLNVKLDSLPTNGTLQVRDWEPYQERGSRREESQGSETALVA